MKNFAEVDRKYEVKAEVAEFLDRNLS